MYLSNEDLYCDCTTLQNELHRSHNIILLQPIWNVSNIICIIGQRCALCMVLNTYVGISYDSHLDALLNAPFKMKINQNLNVRGFCMLLTTTFHPRLAASSRPISLSSIELSIIQTGSWIGSDWKVLAANKWSNLDILINPLQTLSGRLCEAQGKGKEVFIQYFPFLHPGKT